MSVWPPEFTEYEAIACSRAALTRGLTGTWLRGQTGPFTAGATADVAKEKGALSLIDRAFCAADLMSHIAADVERCRSERPAVHVHAGIEDLLPEVWKVCTSLAHIGVKPLTTRMLYDCVCKLCTESTAKRALFAPEPTKGQRRMMLTSEPGCRTFLGHALWIAGYRFLRSQGVIAAAEQLLLECWRQYGERQTVPVPTTDGAKRIYRSHASYQLAKHYMETGERASAARWAMLTFVGDCMTRHFGKSEDIGWDATGATSFLRSHFGVSDLKLQELYEAMRRMEETAQQEKWDRLLAYPAYALSILMTESLMDEGCDVYPPALRNQVGNREQHPLDLSLLQAIWDKIDSGFPKTKWKGDWLERLMAYLFSTIEGVRVRRNMKTEKATSELDLLIECTLHSRRSPGLRFGNRILVECKHRDEAFAACEIQIVLGKMGYHQCDAAVIVCTGGFTRGKHQEAQAAIAFAEQLAASRRIVLLDKKRLEQAVMGTGGAEPPDFLTFLMTTIDRQWDQQAL